MKRQRRACAAAVSDVVARRRRDPPNAPATVSISDATAADQLEDIPQTNVLGSKPVVSGTTKQRPSKRHRRNKGSKEEQGQEAPVDSTQVVERHSPINMTTVGHANMSQRNEVPLDEETEETAASLGRQTSAYDAPTGDDDSCGKLPFVLQATMQILAGYEQARIKRFKSSAIQRGNDQTYRHVNDDVDSDPSRPGRDATELLQSLVQTLSQMSSTPVSTEDLRDVSSITSWGVRAMSAYRRQGLIARVPV